MSKNSHTLHPDVFDCKPAALNSCAVSNGTRQLRSTSMVVGSFFHRRMVARNPSPLCWRPSNPAHRGRTCGAFTTTRR